VRETRHSGWLRRLSAVLAIVWMSVIFLLSGTPHLTPPLSGPGFDKVYHAAAYGLLAVLFLAAMQPDAQTGYRLRQACLAVLLAGAYGLTDEWHQSFVPTRMPDVWDVVADITGAVAGALIVVVVVRNRLRIRFETKEKFVKSTESRRQE
jgi:VanZ family protein